MRDKNIGHTLIGLVFRPYMQPGLNKRKEKEVLTLEMSAEIVEKTILTSEDIVLGNRIAEACSQESFVLYTQKIIDKESKKASVNLWVHDGNNNSLTQLTRCDEGASSPALGLSLPGADSQALFLKGGQVWTIPLEGGESAPVTRFDFSVETFKVFLGPEKKYLWHAL